MLWLLADSVEIVKVATPPESVRVPMLVVPSMKVTVPVGVPDPEVTVAVNVTDWLYTEPLGKEELTVVLVPAPVIVRLFPA